MTSKLNQIKISLDGDVDVTVDFRHGVIRFSRTDEVSDEVDVALSDFISLIHDYEDVMERIEEHVRNSKAKK